MLRRSLVKPEYPEWLAKTGEPVFWAFKDNPKIISRGKVYSHQAGRVYLAGKYYGTWQRPEDIIQCHDVGPGEFAD